MNPTYLVDLINQAQGDRSLTKYARQCGVAPSTLSRIKNNTDNQIAKPDTLKKLASNAQNNITYEALMTAAGYTTDEVEAASINDIVRLLDNQYSSITLDGQVLSPDAINSIREALSFGIKYARLKDNIK